MYDFEDKDNEEEWELIITAIMEEYDDLTDGQKEFFSRDVYTRWSSPYTRMTIPELVDIVRDLAELYYYGIKKGKEVEQDDRI